MSAVTPSPPPAVSLRGAVALSGRFPLLSGVDLEVERGQLVMLRGDNGAGKTSVLRVCAGLVPLVSGRARIFGHDPADVRSGVRRSIGLLAHHAHLYDDLTVEENLRFALRAARADLAALPAAMERLGLTGRLAGTQSGRLSAGQRRRVALCALVARAPALWLMDEPHAGLDESSRGLVDELLVELPASGAAVVVATHETDRVEAAAHRSVTIAGGRVVEAAAVVRPVAATGGSAHVA